MCPRAMGALSHHSAAAVLAVCAIIIVASPAPILAADWAGGGLVAIDSEVGLLEMWKAADNNSFTRACHFDKTIFTPAYAVDASTRTFYYLYRTYSYSRLTARFFGNTPDGLQCSSVSTVCEDKWFTNQTAALIYDPGLLSLVLLDEDLNSTSHEDYTSRLWKLSPATCSLVLMDERPIAPYLLRSEDSYAYDAANHRFYAVYRERVSLPFRIRAVNFSAPDASSALLYDQCVLSCATPLLAPLLLFSLDSFIPYCTLVSFL
eukprot:TRINITY_DN1039_c0_g1_i2.p1 TRINITY_DN1039_c0_g1~~TRINITY_DN1039_c0_g1_i2.p1  ORF type:complete len:262 (-),score=49.40 TRINITY_DN1039_c0_g1_i2:939-1724(-)